MGSDGQATTDDGLIKANSEVTQTDVVRFITALSAHRHFMRLAVTAESTVSRSGKTTVPARTGAPEPEPATRAARRTE
jgi:hypothetical protein